MSVLFYTDVTEREQHKAWHFWESTATRLLAEPPQHLDFSITSGDNLI